MHLFQFFSENIWIKHEKKLCTGDNAAYWKKRAPKGKERKQIMNKIDKLWYQRNYLSCALDIFPK